MYSHESRIVPSDDADFYKITAEEVSSASCIPLTEEDLIVEVKLIPPPNKNYDLYIYDEAGLILGRSDATGDAPHTS